MADDLEQLILSISADTRQISRALKKLETDTAKSTKQIAKQFDDTGKSISAGFVRSLKGLAAPLATIGGLGAAFAGALAVGEISKAADAYTDLGNRLRALGIEGEKTVQTQNEIVQIALRSGSALGSVGELYTRLLSTTKDLGVSQAEVGRATEIISKGFVVSGAAAGEAASASLQLSQAFASGVLRGEEFNAIMENSQPLAQAIAKEFGVTTGQLRAMAEAGELVADRVFKAIIDSGPDIEKAYSTAIPTVERSLGNLGTAFAALIGKMDQTVGFSQKVAGAFTALASTINNLSIKDPLKDAVEQMKLLQAQQRSGQTGAGRLGGAPTGLFSSATPAGRLGGGNSVQQRIDALQKQIDTLTIQHIDEVASEAIKSFGFGSEAGVDFGGGVAKPGTPLPPKRPDDLGKKQTAETVASYKDIQAAANERITQLKVEQTTLGMTTAAAEAYRLEQDLLNQAAQDGIKLSPDQIADLHAKAEAYGAIAAQIETTRDKQQALEQAMQETQGLTQDFFGGIGRSLLDGASAIDALKDAFGRLEQQLLDMALNALIKQLFAALIPGGGVMSGYFGSSGYTNNLSFGGPRAGGGPVRAGTAHKVGEQGEEWFVPDVNGRIIPHHQLAAAGGNAGVPQPVINRVYNQAAGVNVEQRQGTDENGRQTNDFIIGTVQQGMAQGRFNPTMRGSFGVASNRKIRGGA